MKGDNLLVGTGQIPTFAEGTERFLLPGLADGETRAGNATTFTDNMKLPVHRWYRYSAGYSADWAVALMRHWGCERVLDPFGGSGTTNLAAQTQGVESYGVDVHPVVSRIAKAKLAWVADTEEFLARADAVLAEVAKAQPVVVPTSALIEKCFPDTAVLADLLRVRDAVVSLDRGDEVSRLLWLALVSTIRPTSPAGTAQWQYVLPNKTKSRTVEPVSAFLDTCRSFAADMDLRRFLLGGDPAPATFLRADARTLDGVPDGWADAIITSPPYANNYDYADATRLEQIVLGEIEGWSDLRPLRETLLRSATQNLGRWKSEEVLDSDLLRPIVDEFLPVYRELGEVRKTKGGNKAYHAMLAGYFYDNAQVFRALRAKSQAGVKVCYVVGDSAPYGVHAPVERWLGELAVAAGFRTWSFTKVRDRNVKWKNRKHQHPLHEGYLWIEG